MVEGLHIFVCQLLITLCNMQVCIRAGGRACSWSRICQVGQAQGAPPLYQCKSLMTALSLYPTNTLGLRCGICSNEVGNLALNMCSINQQNFPGSCSTSPVAWFLFNNKHCACLDLHGNALQVLVQSAGCAVQSKMSLQSPGGNMSGQPGHAARRLQQPDRFLLCIV